MQYTIIWHTFEQRDQRPGSISSRGRSSDRNTSGGGRSGIVVAASPPLLSLLPLLPLLSPAV